MQYCTKPGGGGDGGGRVQTSYFRQSLERGFQQVKGRHRNDFFSLLDNEANFGKISQRHKELELAAAGVAAAAEEERQLTDKVFVHLKAFQ